MPIIIDTESQDTIAEQLAKTHKDIKSARILDAKYFSKKLTGGGKRKDGILSFDSDLLPEFYDKRQRLLGFRSGYAHNRTTHDIEKELFGAKFFRKTQGSHPDFVQFEENLATLMPPSILRHMMNAAVTTKRIMSFPRDTNLYNLNVVDSTNVWFPLASGQIDGKDATTYARIVIEAIGLHYKEDLNQKTKSTTAHIEPYVLVATVLDDMKRDGVMHLMAEGHGISKPIDDMHGMLHIGRLEQVHGALYDVDAVRSLVLEHHSHIRNASISLIAPRIDEVQAWLDAVSVSDVLRVQATNTSNATSEILMTCAHWLSKHYASFIKKKDRLDPDDAVVIERAFDEGLTAFIQHIDVINSIEEDLVSTELLADIHGALKAHILDAKRMNSLTRHSLRLLLSQRLTELQTLKHEGKLYHFDQSDDVIRQAIQTNPKYSIYQKNIITTDEPLVIAQAGAGSGKSHTLVGRVNYMRDQGEDLKRVLVLSFTNVAAENIAQRCPGVRSETLANMFHTIYQNTFPRQALSQPSTVANAMRLLNPGGAYFQQMGYTDPNELQTFINKFAERLEQFDSTGYKRVDLQQELKHMANLIENNLEMATHILDAVESTTLELQPIIIHTKLLRDPDSLNAPIEYQNLNYIITDESQDISTFEYILLLELTIHHLSQLLIIGDGSQTLYEFRNSDPRYMNALEASGVFRSFKLETNYRSQEEILMYANQFLKVIDANKFANIQLTSSAFRKPDHATLNDSVTILDHPFDGRGEKAYRDELIEFVTHSDEFEEWFIDRMRKGEQVALMAWTRKEVLEVSEVLERLLAKHALNIPITNIMSDNQQPMTILSRFASKTAGTLRALDILKPTYLADVTQLAQNFVRTEFPNASPKQASYFTDKIRKNIELIMQSAVWTTWCHDRKNGTFTNHTTGSLLCQELFRIETRLNAMEQFVRKNKTIPNYDACQLIISTIHGTKGLEFDHTVVIYNETKRNATSQETLRMMFVALSRAKKSELIINTHSAAKRRTVSDSLTAMLQTPINTAWLRTVNDISARTTSAMATGTVADTPDEDE